MSERAELTNEDMQILIELYRRGCFICRLNSHLILRLSIKNLIRLGYIELIEDEFRSDLFLTKKGIQRYKELSNLEKLKAIDMDFISFTHPIPTAVSVIINYVVNQLTEEELPIALVSDSKLIRDLAKTRLYFLSTLPTCFEKEI